MTYRLIFVLDDNPVKISNVLQFVTGSPTIPAGGFENQISVKFEHSCIKDCKCFPIASLCDLSITIPVHIDNVQEMNDIMDTAVHASVAFGRV